MKAHSRFAAAAVILMCLPAGASLAQGTPNAAAPAASAPAPAPEPAATPAPAASPTAATTDKDSATKKKKSGKKMTRQQEIDKSIESGTVPSRYRSQVPKEYQQYVPFAK
jgi:hypothetical protein